jgi:hypothetical protein
VTNIYQFNDIPELESLSDSDNINDDNIEKGEKRKKEEDIHMQSEDESIDKVMQEEYIEGNNKDDKEGSVLLINSMSV